MKRVVLIALVALSLAGLARASALPAEPAPPPSVEMFSPEGEVKGVRQVAVRFSEPMVPFGDPRLPDPFDVAAAAKGKGRWADERNWIYDFDEDLPAGIACTFTLKPSLAALSGRPVGGTRTFSFNTGGPAILRSIPYEGSHYIDEEQAFLLQLDAAADEASLLANTTFSVDGIEEAVGVRIVKGEERQKLLTLGPGRGLIRLPRNARGERDTLEFRRKKNVADDPNGIGSFQFANSSVVFTCGRSIFPPTPAASVTSSNFFPSTLWNRWCLPTQDTNTSGRPSLSKSPHAAPRPTSAFCSAEPALAVMSR